MQASTDILADWQERGFVVLRRAQWLGSVMGPRGEHLATLADEVAELPAANRTPGVAHGPFHSYEIVADGSHAVRLSRTCTAMLVPDTNTKARCTGDDESAPKTRDSLLTVTFCN